MRASVGRGDAMTAKSLREVSEAMNAGQWVSEGCSFGDDECFLGSTVREADATGIALFASENVRKALVEWVDARTYTAAHTYESLDPIETQATEGVLLDALTAALARAQGEKP